MIFNKNKESEGLLKGVWMAYSILMLHVVLVAAMGCLVLFFSGIIQYMMWIFLLSSSLIALSGYRFYMRMKAEKKSFEEMADSPLFRGKSLEITFLGGIASVKVGMPSSNPMLPMPPQVQAPAPIYQPAYLVPQLESPASTRIRELSELARLLDNMMITPDEYNSIKEQLLGNTVNL